MTVKQTVRTPKTKVTASKARPAQPAAARADKKAPAPTAKEPKALKETAVKAPKAPTVRAPRKRAASADGQPKKRGRPIMDPALKEQEEGRPKILKDDVMTAEEMLQGFGDRPLTGRDLSEFAKDLGIPSSELGAALGIQNDYNLAKMMKGATVVPFEVEVLVRIYLEHPSPAPWTKRTPKAVFEELYGPTMRLFSNEIDRAYARIACFNRFTAAMDKSSSTAYRWVAGEEGGKARLPVALLLRKLMSLNEPRETLERIARLVHKVRGGDYDLRAPLPQVGVQQARRGRAPNIAREKLAEQRSYERDPFAHVVF